MASNEFNYLGPMTRRRAANPPNRIEEEKKRRRMEELETRRAIIEAVRQPGPRDIILENSPWQIKIKPNQCAVKQEILDNPEPPQPEQAVVIKQEPEEISGDSGDPTTPFDQVNPSSSGNDPGQQPSDFEVVVGIKEEVDISPTPSPENVYEDLRADQDITGYSIDEAITTPEFTQTDDEPIPQYLDVQFLNFRAESQVEFALLREELAARDFKIQEMEGKLVQFQSVLENLGMELDSVRSQLALNCSVHANNLNDSPNLSESGLLEVSDIEGGDDPLVNAGTFQDVLTGANNLALGDTKVLQLFPEVLKVIWEKFATNSDNGWKCFNLPNCRLTCSTWKVGVDRLLTSKNGPVPSIYCTTIEIHNSQRSTDLMARWINAYKGSSNFPFPPRQVTFIDSENQEFPIDQQAFEHFMSTKLLFLETFGAHILVFKYTMCSNEISRYGGLVEWYGALSTWLWLMPNLEELNLHDLDVPGTWKLKFENPEETDLYRRHPFPLLRNLKSFSVTGNGYNGHLISSALSRNGSSVEAVALKYISTFPATIFSLDSLKSFNLCLSCSSDVDWLCLLKQTGSLEILKIRTDGFWTCDNNHLGRVVHFVESCQVLTSLELTLEANFCAGPVKLKKLEQLTLQVVGHTTKERSHVSFDERLLRMVKKMPCLRKLNIVGLPMERMVLVKNVEVASRSRLGKCVEMRLVEKLWKVAPSLQTVAIELAQGNPFTFIRRKDSSNNLANK